MKLKAVIKFVAAFVALTATASAQKKLWYDTDYDQRTTSREARTADEALRESAKVFDQIRESAQKTQIAIKDTKGRVVKGRFKLPVRPDSKTGTFESDSKAFMKYYEALNDEAFLVEVNKGNSVNPLWNDVSIKATLLSEKSKVVML